MKTILVYHWIGKIKELNNTYAEHKAEQPYSKERREIITQLVLDKGYNVLLQQLEDKMVIHVDNKRFKQR